MIELLVDVSPGAIRVSTRPPGYAAEIANLVVVVPPRRLRQGSVIALGESLREVKAERPTTPGDAIELRPFDPALSHPAVAASVLRYHGLRASEALRGRWRTAISAEWLRYDLTWPDWERVPQDSKRNLLDLAATFFVDQLAINDRLVLCRVRPRGPLTALLAGKPRYKREG